MKTRKYKIAMPLPSEKIVSILQQVELVPEVSKAKFRRLYPTERERLTGGWLWEVAWPGGRVGSTWTVRRCLSAKRLHVVRDSRGVLTDLFPVMEVPE